MKNITELINKLGVLYKSLDDNNIERKTAGEMNNTAGKIIKALKIQVEYNELMRNGKEIKFLKDGK